MGQKTYMMGKGSGWLPNIDCYKNANFSTSNLTMLGANSTCKDRWRQILSEADRIEHKHLLTLETAISTYQTNEMKNRNLQLVVPLSIQKSYTDDQQKWLYSFRDFLDEVTDKQRHTEYASVLRV